MIFLKQDINRTPDNPVGGNIPANPLAGSRFQSQTGKVETGHSRHWIRFTLGADAGPKQDKSSSRPPQVKGAELVRRAVKTIGPFPLSRPRCGQGT